MKHRLLRLLMPLVLLASLSVAVDGQGGGTLTGTVTDSSGAFIPGADIVAKNNATGVTYNAVSSGKGTFTIPAMAVGTYTVTVSLMGFKTFQVPDVTLSTNGPTSLKATLEVGALSETVVVKGGAEIVQTQSTVIATTLNATQITKLPLVSRDAMNFLTMLPGVDTSGTSRSSTISGLPTGAINITIDGVNTQDNNNRTTDGFFSLISPRLDAVEEVTVQTAAQGADSAGQGAVQIKFTTRSGTNRYSGSGYYYLRDPRFNSNYWFNNRDKAPDPKTGKAPKDQVKLYQPGFRFGGPIAIPGLYDGHDKAFFFINYEQFRQPNPVTRQRLVMSDTARDGTFRYGTGGVNSVNVLAVAAANNQVATMDPVVRKLLADIAASTSQGTVTERTDPNTADFVYTSDSKQLRHYPTWRLDYNLTNNHRISYTTWFQKYTSFPDTLNNADARFPGFPVAGGQTSDRINITGSVRSTLGKNLVNQFVTGYTKSTVNFFTEVTPASFTGTPVGDQAGFALGINAFASITTPTATTSPQARNNPTIDVNDTLTWLRGNHSYTAGGTFTHIGLWAFNQTPVPTIAFGIASGDPAASMFNTTNFPGASGTDLTNAQNLYAVLTGRVSQISANARLGDSGQYQVPRPGRAARPAHRVPASSRRTRGGGRRP